MRSLSFLLISMIFLISLLRAAKEITEPQPCTGHIFSSFWQVLEHFENTVYLIINLYYFLLFILLYTCATAPTREEHHQAKEVYRHHKLCCYKSTRASLENLMFICIYFQERAQINAVKFTSQWVKAMPAAY